MRNPFNDDWKQRHAQEGNQAKCHMKEDTFADRLKVGLKRHGMIAERIPGVFSDYDIEIYHYDWKNLKKGDSILRIDVEQKSEIDKFPKEWYPERWYRGVSFLNRKVVKNANRDRDVYVLLDSDVDHPGVIWATYEMISLLGVYYDRRGPENQFYEVKENADKLNYTFRSLVKWCNEIKVNRTIGPLNERITTPRQVEE